MSDQQKYLNKLKNKHVLIIGGSSGIGFGVAEACLEYGARVTISSSSSERLTAAVNKLKTAYPSAAASRIAAATCDLGDATTLESNVAALFKSVGEINHVVYTAGDGLLRIPLAEVTVAQMQKVTLVRVNGVILAAREAVKYLPASPESSFTITSGSAADKPIPGTAATAFFAGSHASMARSLALDLKPIRFNVVGPGAVDTELWKMPEEQKKAMFKQFEAQMTTGRVGRVEDVAEAFLYCMKDTNVSGSVISTNGGAFLT